MSPEDVNRDPAYEAQFAEIYHEVRALVERNIGKGYDGQAVVEALLHAARASLPDDERFWDAFGKARKFVV